MTKLVNNYKFNSDAQAMTRYSLKQILKKTYTALSSQAFNNATMAHLEFAAEKIEAIFNAEIQLN